MSKVKGMEMDAGLTIIRPFQEPSATGSSFELEIRDLLWSRCRFVFALFFGLSFIMSIFFVFILRPPPLVETPFSPWINKVWFGYVASFALALVLLYVLKPTVRQLQILDFAVIAFNLVLSVSAFIIFFPTDEPFFSVAILLFIHAAFIPCRVRYQIGLGIAAVLAVFLAHSLTYTYLPETRAFWDTRAEEELFTVALIWGTVGTAVLAAVSVVVTHALYSLRRTAHHVKQLGNYLIKKEIGKGGMGQVFMARHALMCRPTAVKVMQSSKAEHKSALERFEREVRLSSTLTHPNTITIFDFSRTGEDTFYYAMEYLQGMDLQGLVERFGPQPAERIAFILVQACGSLAEAHERNIIHRDIKPSNIFLTHRGGLYDFVKVLDFGMAKQIEADQKVGLTKPGMLFGTPRYISPEAVYGTIAIDARADLYNLGAVAYWMLTGEPPFTSTSSVELIIEHVKTIPKPPSAISELPIPQAMDDLVMKCLEKDPKDRFQKAAELEAAIRALGFDEPWTKEKAKKWWELHAPEEIGPPEGWDCGAELQQPEKGKRPTGM